MPLILQQRSVIRYLCLREKTNAQIASKLEMVYHGEALRIMAVERQAMRFRRGQETVEDDVRFGKPSNTDCAEAIL
jgi:hypothetical protein